MPPSPALNLHRGILALVLLPLLLNGCEKNKQAAAPSPAFDLARIDAKGGEYKADGNDQTHPWACVRDNLTHLVWEVKTTEGLQAAGNTYSWFNSDAAGNGGDPGTADSGGCYESRCDTQSYIAALNKAQVCGYQDWRLPQRDELRTLVDRNIPHPGPTIALGYFPHTDPGAYWTATPSGTQGSGVWAWRLDDGTDFVELKKQPLHVLAVRGAPVMVEK